jgi:hypothetical protein
MAPADAVSALRSAVLAFHQKPVMAKAELSPRGVGNWESGVGRPAQPTALAAKAPAVVVSYKRQQTARQKNSKQVFAPPPVFGRRVVAAAAR